MPPPLLRASSSSFPIGHLIHCRENVEERAYWREEDGPWLMGHRLPPFQRGFVWDLGQQVRFIESAWLGLHLGTYVINRNESWDRVNDKPHRTDRWIIDGQQRLRALDRYLGNRFPVFGHYWAQLDRVEQRRLDNTTFTQSIVHEGDEAVLRELYNRLNFGGTAHTEEQRA
jgi:hypothetical protein